MYLSPTYGSVVIFLKKEFFQLAYFQCPSRQCILPPPPPNDCSHPPPQLLEHALRQHLAFEFRPTCPMEGCRFTTSLSDLVELARHTLTTHPGLTFSGGALQAVRRQRPGGLPQRWIPPPLAGMAKIREKARLYVRGTSHVRAARADMQANDRLFTVSE